MQAILLSAGRGQRLAPLTDTVPKPLIEIGGKPLIDHQLEKLAKAGIEKVVINTGWLGQQVINHVGSGKHYGLRVVYSVEPQTALETAGGIIQALPMLDVNHFIVCNADVLHEFDFSILSDIQLDSSEAHVILIDNPEHNPAGDFSLQEDKLVNRSEGDLETFTYSGIGLYSKLFFSGLVKGRRGLGSLLRAKADTGVLTGQVFAGAWFDAGTKTRLDTIEQYLKQEES